MNTSWLATEAQTLHAIFQNAFYVMISTFLVIGIILEYFKFPLGGMPAFSQLIGRVFIACMLMVATPDIMNMLSHVTDGFVGEIGKLIEFKHVYDRLQEKLGTLSWSWVSVKDTLIIIISYLSFYALYLTVYLADAVFLFSWILLYIFSPVLIALFIFPLTSSATILLFKSMIEVCAWKVVWTCFSALLWSMALSDINKAGANISFLTVILMNLMLVLSVALTPKITAAFLGGGISGIASGFGDSLRKLTNMNPNQMLNKTRESMQVGRSSIRKINFQRERKPKAAPVKTNETAPKSEE